MNKTKKLLRLKLWWESQSATKKGLFIGLVVGIIWAIPTIIGMSTCGWNFLEWKSSLSFCNNGIIQAIFYLPYVYVQAGIVFATLFIFNPPEFIFLVLPVVIIVFIFSMIGILIGRGIKR